MKFASLPTAVLPIALALQSCALANSVKSIQTPVSPSSDFCVREQGLVSHVKAAESGSVDDMKLLYWHYLGCVSNRELAFYWGKQAADRCDLEMQDEIEQWLHSFRDKSIEKIIPAITSSWKRHCSASSK